MESRHGCEFIARDDGIYHAVFYDRLRPTIDQYFKQVHRIYAAAPSDQMVKFLIDTRPSGGQIPVLKYITDISREVDKMYPNRPPLAVAIVLEMSIFARIMDISLSLLIRRMDRMRFFDLTQPDQAIAWLNQLNVAKDS